MSLRLVLILTLVIALLSCQTIQSEAAEQSFKGKVVGIVIEKSCLISDRCMNYSDIVDLDTTDPKYMGKFIEKNGDLTRQSTSKQNNYRWLEFQKDFTIVVDPPLKFRTQIPIITIVSQLDEFHIRGQEKVIEYKQTPDAKATMKVRSFSHTRYVDQTCTNAVITAKNWQKVLPDTINYLRGNCDPKHTQIETIGLDVGILTKHDIGTSSKNKLEKFYAHVLKECTKTRNACTSLENRAVTTMGDSK